MQIKNIEVISNRYPLVTVTTDEGLTGIGATSASPAVIRNIIESEEDGLRQMLIGEDPTQTNRLWRKMYYGYPGNRGRACEGGVDINAMAAIDMALWDLSGKACQLPIHQLLGGAVQPRMLAYASATAADMQAIEERGVWVDKTEKQFRHECETFLELGFKAIKFGWGDDFGPRRQKLLAAIRDTIGSEVRLMLDMGPPDYSRSMRTVKDVIEVSRVAEEFDVYFLEEPMLPDDIAGHRAVKDSCDVRIATGESLTTIRQFIDYLEQEAVDVIQPDAQQIGITQFCRVAQRAEEDRILCIPHSPWTAMAIAAHVNVLSTVINSVMIEYPAFASYGPGTRGHTQTRILHEDIIEHPLVFEDGFIELPTRPGLGLGEYVPGAVEELGSS